MGSLKENLGHRIQQIRKSKGITQEKLAEMIELDTPNLSNIETGKRFLSAETLEKIIKALNVKASELFDFDHINTKEILIKYINDILNESDLKDLEYYYRLIKYYKER